MGENQRIFIITSQTMSKLTKNICDLSATDIVWVLTFSEEDQNLAASLELASDTFNIISCEIYNNKIQQLAEEIENQEVQLTELVNLKNNFRNKEWKQEVKQNIEEIEEVEEETAVLPFIEEINV